MTDCNVGVNCSSGPGGARGLCGKHYQQWRAGTIDAGLATITTPNRELECAFSGCDRSVYARLFCEYHYRRRHKYGGGGDAPSAEGCLIIDCDRFHRAGTGGGLCAYHAKMAWRYGLTPPRLIEVLAPAACANKGCGGTENLHIDHDHACCPPGSLTGSKASCGRCVRGLLCRSCNIALGQLQENPRKIRGLLGYLKV